jgi:hypothetical protein
MRLLDVVEEVYATNLDPYCQGDEKDANDIGRERTLKAVHEGSIKITMLSGINLMTEL